MGFKQIFKKITLTEADKIGPVDTDTVAEFSDSVKNKINEEFGIPKKLLINDSADKTEVSLVEEEWVWIDGFKGTDAHMRCMGYQFEMNRQFDIPTDVKPKECESGFHLCFDLKQVFSYYDIENGNRFFKVKALVRKSELDVKQGGIKTSGMTTDQLLGYMYSCGFNSNKITSKSIIFLSELTPDEVLAATNYDTSEWGLEDKIDAMKNGPHKVDKRFKALELIDLGYSELLSAYLVAHDKYNIAKVVASQKDISMDARIIAIFSED